MAQMLVSPRCFTEEWVPIANNTRKYLLQSLTAFGKLEGHAGSTHADGIFSFSGTDCESSLQLSIKQVKKPLTVKPKMNLKSYKCAMRSSGLMDSTLAVSSSHTLRLQLSFSTSARTCLARSDLMVAVEDEKDEKDNGWRPGF